MKKINWISRRIQFSLIMILVVLAAAGCNRQYFSLQQQMKEIVEMRVLTLRMVKYTAEASNGKIEAFSLLKGTAQETDSIIQSLRMGDPSKNLVPLPTDADNELAALEGRWKDFKKNTDIILKHEGTIRILKEFVRAIHDVSPALAEVSNDIALQLSDKNTSAKVMYFATNQTALANRIALHVDKMILGGPTSADAVDQFGRDATQFGRILEALQKGDKELKIKKITAPKIIADLKKADNLFRTQTELLKKILERSAELFRAQDAQNKIFLLSDGLTSDVELLYERLTYLMR